MTSGPADAPRRSTIGRATLLFSVLLIVVSAVAFLAGSAHMGGCDSYFFLLYASDLAQSASGTSFARYSYFPGSYEFWRAVAMAAGRDFAVYQRVFAGVALTNAALTGLIVRAAGGGALLAAGSFAGYLIFGRRLELGLMTTESIATLAALVGLLLWLTLRRRRHELFGLACLGTGYGLAVFTKQQGAFVAFGAVGLAPALFGGSRPWRRGVTGVVVVVVTAVAVFAVSMGLDGGGVAAVKLGIAAAVDYESHGRLAAHLVEQARKTPALFAALAGAVLLWPVAYVLSKRRPGVDPTSRLDVWGVAVATAVVTLFQLSKRSYAHYVLLTLPFALMAVSMATVWVWQRMGGTVRLGVAALVAAAAVLGLEAWALPGEPGSVAPLRHEAYASTCEGIQPGRRLLLLPSRENALHWACGTNARGTRWGYTFNFQETPDEYIEEIAKPELQQVFVFKADAEHTYEREVARRHDWSGFFSALSERGFRPVSETAAGTLFWRAAAGPAAPAAGASVHEEAVHGHE